jgi:Na+-translocating ferredoxin:NAD+ oxidoreductase RnfD subunit
MGVGPDRTTMHANNAMRCMQVLFNNQNQEVQQYDAFLAQYQLQMNRIERLGAQLNAGQAIILNCGIVAALGAAVMRAPGGPGVLPGDLVLIHGMLLQLWAPLQFLGWFWRCAALDTCSHYCTRGSACLQIFHGSFLLALLG